MRALAAAELAPAARQRLAVEMCLQLVEQLRQAAVDQLGVGQAGVRGAEEPRQLALGWDVVGAPHHQQRPCLRPWLEELPDRLDAGDEGVFLHREGRADAVASGHVDSVRHVLDQDLAAVGAFPNELARRQRFVGAAPEDAALDAEAAQQGRQVGDLAEGVWQVADGHHPAERLRHAVAAKHVAHQRFAAGEELVGDHVPGPHGEPPFSHEARDRLSPVGAYLQVVLDQDRVAVEQEVAVLCVPLQDVDQ